MLEIITPWYIQLLLLLWYTFINIMEFTFTMVQKEWYHDIRCISRNAQIVLNSATFWRQHIKPVVNTILLLLVEMNYHYPRIEWPITVGMWLGLNVICPTYYVLYMHEMQFTCQRLVYTCAFFLWSISWTRNFKKNSNWFLSDQLLWWSPMKSHGHNTLLKH